MLKGTRIFPVEKGVSCEAICAEQGEVSQIPASTGNAEDGCECDIDRKLSVAETLKLIQVCLSALLPSFMTRLVLSLDADRRSRQHLGDLPRIVLPF